MSDAQTPDEKIEALEAIQDAGASSTSIDGVTTTFDFEEIRRRKRELEAQDPARRTRRPRSSSINLRNSW